MARWQLGENYKRRAKKSLTIQDQLRAARYLERLGKHPPPGNLGLKPLEGTKGKLWECWAGGQNRFILRRESDDQGHYFIVEDVGPHDICRKYSP
ncbi:MAG: hypothetical protein WBW73_00330 [Rhodoplanes sp.]